MTAYNENISFRGDWQWCSYSQRRSFAAASGIAYTRKNHDLAVIAAVSCTSATSPYLLSSIKVYYVTNLLRSLKPALLSTSCNLIHTNESYRVMPRCTSYLVLSAVRPSCFSNPQRFVSSCSSRSPVPPSILFTAKISEDLEKFLEKETRRMTIVYLDRLSGKASSKRERLRSPSARFRGERVTDPSGSLLRKSSSCLIIRVLSGHPAR